MRFLKVMILAASMAALTCASWAQDDGYSGPPVQEEAVQVQDEATGGGEINAPPQENYPQAAPTPVETEQPTCPIPPKTYWWNGRDVSRMNNAERQGFTEFALRRGLISRAEARRIASAKFNSAVRCAVSTANRYTDGQCNTLSKKIASAHGRIDAVGKRVHDLETDSANIDTMVNGNPDDPKSGLVARTKALEAQLDPKQKGWVPVALDNLTNAIRPLKGLADRVTLTQWGVVAAILIAMAAFLRTTSWRPRLAMLRRTTAVPTVAQQGVSVAGAAGASGGPAAGGGDGLHVTI